MKAHEILFLFIGKFVRAFVAVLIVTITAFSELCKLYR